MTIRPGWSSTRVAERSDPEFTRNLFGMSDVRLVVMVLYESMPSNDMRERPGSRTDSMGGREGDLELVERSDNFVNESGRVLAECVYE